MVTHPGREVLLNISYFDVHSGTWILIHHNLYLTGLQLFAAHMKPFWGMLLFVQICPLVPISSRLHISRLPFSIDRI